LEPSLIDFDKMSQALLLRSLIDNRITNIKNERLIIYFELIEGRTK